MRPPELSSTHSMYCVAVATAFHVYVGAPFGMLPDGAISVAAPGGVPGSMKKTTTVDVPPPGAGDMTVTDDVPAVAMSGAGIVAVSCVSLTNVVALALPFHCTTEAATKFVPVAVSVKLAPPATVLLGGSVASGGAGLAAPLMAHVTELEVPPAGVGGKTATE